MSNYEVNFPVLGTGNELIWFDYVPGDILLKILDLVKFPMIPGTDLIDPLEAMSECARESWDDDKKQECWERVWNDCQRYRSVGREPATFMLDVAVEMDQPQETIIWWWMLCHLQWTPMSKFTRGWVIVFIITPAIIHHLTYIRETLCYKISQWTEYR